MTEKQNPEGCLKSLLSVNKVLQNSTQKDMTGYAQYRYFKKIRKDGFGAFRIVPYTRKRAIRYYCQECVGFVYQEVVDCSIPECPLFPYRLEKTPKMKIAQDRSKAIRNHCLECCSGDTEYISNCPSSLCPVHPFRLPGYQTDKSSLIPATEIENFPKYAKGFEDLKEKIAV